MTIATCCGDQDRNTKASETHPNRPPNDTRNCYTRDSFDWNTCGTQSEKACLGRGGCEACIADDIGGYCDDNGKIFVAEGNNFVELKGTQIIDRFRDRDNRNNRDDIRIRRGEIDFEREVENKIREMQIMGQDPLPQRTTSHHPLKTQPTQSFIGSYINIIALGLGILLVLISIGFEYTRNKKSLS